VRGFDTALLAMLVRRIHLDEQVTNLSARGLGFQQRRWITAERRHPTGRERMGSPTLQTLPPSSRSNLAALGLLSR
jgi:hypothetical protein